ncbi:MAG: Rpn family recombination-promoting nuclease/putative transposase [Planctomycetes bacterium]|jgi:hypothetical protein|nr:Rpn family recombination-promoting nuclease/putative transposase [Planctomycetota bacterium]
MSRSPHDELFRYAFQQVEHAAGLFRSLLPPAVVAAIDWSTLRLQAGSYVDKRLRREQSDLLYSTRIGPRPALLYLLTEHKSRSARWAVWQMAQYVHAIWRAQRQRRQLPLVLPILLHHGRRPWTAPRSLHDLLGGKELDPELRGPLLELQPSFQPLIVSMADWPPERFRGLQLTVFGKLVCEALQRLPGASPDELLAVLRSWRELVAELLVAPSEQESLQALWTYVLRTATGRPEPVIEVVDELMEVEFMSKRKTAASYLLEEGHHKGRIDLLRSLIRARFGPSSTAVDARLEAASHDELERWAVQLLTAATLDDVFRDG